ncbi:MAG: hypothetical protein EOS60_33195 [Mesorhizobium sp.]|nr:MAG: hypothetical protein EOS60_33195 [Mesorhizobium sp.]
MRVNVLTYPLGYLSLEDEAGNRLFKRNWVAVAVVVILLSAPFILVDANYFGDNGFLDRFGSFAAVLTGFYIAALVGVASFASSVGDLDVEIEVGPIRRRKQVPAEVEQAEEDLTRRQYICSMFGYLAFVSLFLSVAAIILLVAAEPAKILISLAIKAAWRPEAVGYCLYGISGILIVGFNVVLAHLLVTTCHGLYYLIDRLYDQKPKLLSKGARKTRTG